MSETFGQSYLVHAVTGTTGNPILEQIRALGSEVVLALFRLVKIAIVHRIDNDAVTQTLERTHASIADFCAAVGMNASLTFLDDTVFVCGQLLRASRGVYQSALELGELLERAGVSEISIEPQVAEADLKKLALTISTALRDPSRRAQAAGAPIPHVTLRKKDPVLARRVRPSALSVKERILRVYASALVVMRRFFASVGAGASVVPHRVKRLGQSLVGLADLGDPAMLGMTAMATAHRDAPSRAVHTAILAVIVARQFTTDRLDLARLATAALLADIGRAALAGSDHEEKLTALDEEAESRVPHATSELCITTGGINFPNALRTATTFETTWMERADTLGPPYEGGLAPLLQSRLLVMIRALFDRLAPRDHREAVSPLEALRALAADPDVDPALLRALVRAVGVVPAGSVVELDTKAWAVVIAESKDERALDRPRIVVVTDPNGRALVRPREVDLGVEGGPRIVRVLGPSCSKFNVARLFLGPDSPSSSTA